MCCASSVVASAGRIGVRAVQWRGKTPVPLEIVTPVSAMACVIACSWRMLKMPSGQQPLEIVNIMARLPRGCEVCHFRG